MAVIRAINVAAAAPRSWLLGALVVLCAAAQTSHAATISLTGTGGAGGGYGNELQFSADGIALRAVAFAETGAETAPGSGYYALQSAELYSWGAGLGICSQAEGLAGSSCDSSENEMDTVGRDELLVLLFDQRVSFLSLELVAEDGPGSDANDRDILYRVGDLPLLPDLTPYGLNSLGAIAGLGGEQLSAALSGYSPVTHALTGMGNAIFLYGNFSDRSCASNNIASDRECEAYKITGISVNSALTPQQVVPIPAAGWLLMSALGVLAGLRRRCA